MAADSPDKGSPHDRARIVRRYLSALDARKPGRTTARTADTVAHRMHQIDTLLLSADPVQRLLLTQERIDLHAEQLRLTTSSGDFDQLEKAFTRVAKAWGDRHDITFSAWRQVGVEADVLARANILPAPKPARNQPQGARSEAVSEPVAESAPAKYKAAETSSDGRDLASAVPQTADAAKTDAPVKKSAATKKPSAAKKAPATKKAASANGAAGAASEAKPAAAKKAASKPEQQRLPAEAHLLS